MTTRTVLGYVHELGGDAAVQAVLEAADLPHSPAELNDLGHWVSYDSRIRLFEATAAHFGDPQVMYEAGRSSMRRGVAPSVVLAMRSMGSPAEIYRLLPGSIAKYSTTSTMELVACGRNEATFRFRLHEGYQHSRLDCLYAQGLIASIPEAFDLPPAEITHAQCESDGAQACHYHVTWLSSDAIAAATGGAALAMENAALRRQLDDLRSATGDLVSGHDLQDVLQRVVERAASAVVARGYLLVVRGDDRRPRVHSHGLSPAELAPLSEALLAGEDLGAAALAVEVSSTRRRYGWLAAVQSQPIKGDREALRSYARHAAAALDLVSALAASRRDAERAQALLELAHQLAEADRPETVVDVVAGTLTAAVGCSAASVMLWDEQAGVLRAARSTGNNAEAERVLRTSAFAPDEVPELAALLAQPSVQMFRRETASPALAALMHATGVEHLLVAPMLSAGRLYGVLTGSWPSLSGDSESDLKRRLRGVADQAATALRNTQLTADVRHQAEHDELTGLPNRRLFLRRLQDALAPTVAGWTGVLFCDLDGFKAVNDRFGHAVGDELLRHAAGRIRAAVRATDEVGRLSGDEFAVVLPALRDTAEASVVAQRLVESLRRPFRVEGQVLDISASVGLALHRGGGDAGRLLRAADQAMYAAKQGGRNRVAQVPVTAP